MPPKVPEAPQENTPPPKWQEPEPVPELTQEELEQRQAVLDEIFAECPADEMKKRSLEEREAAGKAEDYSLTYGEVDMAAMHRILGVVKHELGLLTEKVESGHFKGTFLDLGSGCGKACLSASLLHPFEKVVGVECLNGLSTDATAAAEKYREVALPDGVAKSEVELTKGDFVSELDGKIMPLAAEVALCFAVATCYGEPQLQAMAKLAGAMLEGSLFVTFTQMLPESAVSSEDGGWTLLGSLLLEMLWGPSTCFVFMKLKPSVEIDDVLEESPPATS